MPEMCTANFMDCADKKTNEWVLQSAGTERHLLESVKTRKMTYVGPVLPNLCAAVESGRGVPSPNVGNQMFSMRSFNEVYNCH